MVACNLKKRDDFFGRTAKRVDDAVVAIGSSLEWPQAVRAKASNKVRYGNFKERLSLKKRHHNN